MDHEPRVRPALILDVGGVLLTDPMPILFSRLAQAGEKPLDSLLEFYRAQLRHAFWDGSLAEDEFWSHMLCAAGLSSSESGEWRRELLSWQTPLPAIGRLDEWSQRARIILLSNHRSDWVRPLLAVAGIALPAAGVALPPADQAVAPRGAAVQSPVEQALVSEETGLAKPDAAAFQAALDAAGPGVRCLFADDQAANVQAARAVGLPAILADGEARWMGRVDAWLDGSPEGTDLPPVDGSEGTLES